MKLNRTIRNKDHMDNLIKFLDSMEIPEDGVDVTLMDHEEKRTLEQNAFMWRVAYTPIAEQIGEATGRMLTKDDIHEFMTKQFAARVERTCPVTGEVSLVPKSTTKFTRKEMSDYLDQVFAWGAHHQVWFE